MTDTKIDVRLTDFEEAQNKAVVWEVGVLKNKLEKLFSHVGLPACINITHCQYRLLREQGADMGIEVEVVPGTSHPGFEGEPGCVDVIIHDINNV